MLAPIALFVHSRLDHTERTVSALQQNMLAQRTPLYIFSDGARDDNVGERLAVNAVREYLKSITGFLSVEIIERSENLGLKRNILDGLNSVTTQYDSVIVIEDDCVTSSDFLQYMNHQLAAFKCDETVWHIASWSPGLNVEGDIYRSHFMSCWGWATWSECWKKLNLDAYDLMRRMSIRDRYRFNLSNTYPFFSHLVGNFLGQNNTWAIYWAATVFTNGGFCINPVKTRLTNVGMDGSGSHKVQRMPQETEMTPSHGMGRVVTDPYVHDELQKKLHSLLKFRERLFMWLKMLFPVKAYKLIYSFKEGIGRC